jgi:hypothetical protein
MRGVRVFFILLLLAGLLGGGLSSGAQEGEGLSAGDAENSGPGAEPGAGEPAALVGFTLEALIRRFGPPRSVYPVRGPEEWQDDVVFVYPQGDFYLYRDRVWQVGVEAAAGIRTGDSRELAALVLGAEARDRGDHVLADLAGADWPLTLRCNFDGAGKVTAIFIYRSGL